MWTLTFISEEDFTKHVKKTIEKYGEKLESFDLKCFNKNIIDPIKLIFDKTVYHASWEEIVSNEIFRQRDKSNNNDIGYFHQRIFNREFAYDYLHYDGSDYESGYSNNYSYTKAITTKGINEVIKCAKENNDYNLPQHNCVHVAITAWNIVFPEDSFAAHTFPKGLKDEIRGRNGSRVFDILTEVLGFENNAA